VATDYFDASINRLAAYTVGLRATRKAILYAMLDPTKQLQSLEAAGDRTSRMALMDEMKAMPFGSVWAECCRRAGVPQDLRWMDGVKRYEARVLSRR
jgi:L-rhamnose isomerase